MFILFKRMLCVLCLFVPTHLVAKDIHIVTTIKPIESLIANIIDANDSVSSIIDGNYSPHNFSLKPSHIAKIYKSDVVILINSDFETFMRSSFKIIPEKTTIITLSSAKDLVIYPTAHYNNDDYHQYDSTDYHIWLSADNAVHIINDLADKLSALNPEKQAIYHYNAQTAITKILKLNDTLKAQLSPITDKPFMVFHNGFQYFVKNYDLNLVGTITDNPAVYSSVQQIKTAQQNLHDNAVMCVFKEPQFSDKTIETVITGTETKIGTLDPLGGDIPSGKTQYFTLMENLAKSFLTCLTPNNGRI